MRYPHLQRLTTVAALCVASMLSSTVLEAQQQPGVSLGIRYVAGQKTSLLVLPIAGAGGDSVAAIIARDLDYSDRFTVTPPPPGPVATTVNYAVYARLGVDGVLQGTLLPGGNVRIVLHDVAKKAVRNTRDFVLVQPVTSPGGRMSVHGVSDAVEEWVTGERGIAQSQIAFVRGDRIWTVDSDGANVTARTSQGIHPAWMPNGRGLAYSVLGSDRQSIYVTDLVTGAQRNISSAPSGTQDYSPAVSPDGRSIMFARMTGTGTDLFSMPVSGGSLTRITVGRGTGNISPSFSPNGDRIVFTSDRVGNPEVYIADADGTNPEPLTSPTYGEKSHRAEGKWSPNGQFVAYMSRMSDVNQVMMLSLRTMTPKQITSDGRNEQPSWAPDSRHLVVTSNRSGSRQLWVVDIETGRSRQLTRGSDARFGAWSPRLSP
jgi:TolB protein